VRLEGLGKLKNPIISFGTEPATNVNDSGNSNSHSEKEVSVQNTRIRPFACETVFSHTKEKKYVNCINRYGIARIVLKETCACVIKT
jgi:hypothetical protein